jgi:hypothetical protein
MISIKEIREWLDTLPNDAEIGIDEAVLGLQVYGSEAGLVVGGLPDEEEDAEANAFLERVQEAGRRREGNKIEPTQ